MMKKLWNHWDHFWFAPQNTLNLALMRVVLLGTLFYVYFMRLWNLDYYTSASWVTQEKALELIHESYRPLFSWFFFPDSFGPMAHYLLVGLLFLGLIGLGNKAVLLLAWALDMAFIQRNYAVNFGADIIGALFLFYIAWTPCSERLSVKNLIFKKRSPKEETGILGSVFYRMMMLQISVVYAYTGFEKLKGVTWWDGTALWSVLGNPQMTTMDFTWLRQFPFVIAIMTFVTVLFEIYWPFAMLIKSWRYAFLALGVFFHMGIALAMGLTPFSLVMISTYFLFLYREDLEKIVSFLDFGKKKVS